MQKFCIAISAFLLFTFLLKAQNESDIQAGYDKLQKKNYQGAILDFKKVLDADPNNIQGMCGMALAQNGNGNTTEAMKLADAVISKAPQAYDGYYAKAEISSSQKDYKTATTLYTKALEINSLHALSIIGLSKVSNLQGDIKNAYKILDDAIERQPANADLYYARGILNNSKEKYSKAIDDFDKAISLKSGSNNFGNYLNRGIAHFNLEESDAALIDIDKALELDPENATAHYSRGLVNYQMGNYEEAVKDFNKANELSPNNAVTLYNLGMAYYKLDDIENACMNFHKSCSMNNTNSCKMIILTCSEKAGK